jgi:hypothetical protein
MREEKKGRLKRGIKEGGSKGNRHEETELIPYHASNMKTLERRS